MRRARNQCFARCRGCRRQITALVGDLNMENIKFVTPATTAVCAVRVTRASRGAAAAEGK